jgi:hypothetical protein
VAFPDDLAFPSKFAQKSRCIPVPLPIFSNLFDPIFAIVDWHTITTRAVMTMPEATMDENNFLQAAKDNIRTTRQILSMEPVTISLGIQ